MASVMDQYEQSQARGTSGVTQNEPVTTGYINARTEDDLPMFNKQRIEFRPPEPITHLVVANNLLILAMTNNVLLRIDLENPKNLEEVELTRPGEDKIYQMYMDPTGRHLIVSMRSSDVYYLGRNSKKPRSLSKMKGHIIESIGWNRQSTGENSTGSILVGTNRGTIYETAIESAGDDLRFFQGSLEQYWKQLFNLGKDKPTPVTGLEFDKMSMSSASESKYFIMATTPECLYQFIGTVPNSSDQPIFQRIFAQYEDVPEMRFLHFPESFGYSQLQFFYPKFRGAPKSFAWMNGSGIYAGEIDLTGSAGHDSVTTNAKLIPYPKDENEQFKPPVGIALTEFHVLILFPDRLKGVCTLNDQQVYDSVFTERFGKLRGMCKDPLRGTIWAFADQAVFKYKVFRETRDVWQMFLAQGEFDLAREYCKDNPANVDRVMRNQAEHLFNEKKYSQSAILYAQTQTSFEEIALKFIQVDEKDALKTFLRKKLSSLTGSESTQITMLVMWLIEIYLNQLAALREQENDVSTAKHEDLQDDFHKFLALGRVKDCISQHRTTVYDLINSHGDIDDMIYFAFLIQDYKRVVDHHIQHANYVDALEVLVKNCQNKSKLFYKYSPLLMQNIPKQTVDAWITMGQKLNPDQLIPALVQYDHSQDQDQGNEAIRYLEHCINRLSNREQAIHNYLLSLYTKFQKEKLLQYLYSQGQDPERVCYDVKFALRLCSEHRNLDEACVQIYSCMGLYEEAVDLALKVNVELAKQNADKPDDDEELRKKLWLRIARHVVEEEKDIKRAMEFLHECDLLKIEDVLPFFPDFVTIDHFKEAICTSLNEYNQHIESLKEEMDDATDSARDIRGEIQGFRNKYAFVRNQDKCAACNFPLMSRTFYVFPCLHKFHTDCLISEVLPNLGPALKSRVEYLQRAVGPSAESMSNSSSSQSLQKDIPAKVQLDEIVAAECVYCGEYMIRNIDKPFIEDNEYEQTLESWS